MACAATSSDDSTDRRDVRLDDAGIRVMTFNVRNEGADADRNAWDYRGELVTKLISSYMPDVVGLQESSGGFQVEDLNNNVDGMTLVSLSGHRQGRRNSLLYRIDRLEVEETGVFWLSDTPDEFSASWGNTYPRSVSWVRFLDKSNDRAFYVYNTHFDHESENARRRSAVSIVSRIAGRNDPAAPFILTGDFNSAEESVVVQYFRGIAEMEVAGTTQKLSHLERLVDTFRFANPDAEVVGTAAPFGRGRLSQKVDYIFVGSDQWIINSSRILDDQYGGRFPSDHLPVLVDLHWPPDQ